MIIVVSAEIQSTEGTTKGYILAMSFYATVTASPLQQLLHISIPHVKHVGLADDATNTGSLKSFKKLVE